MASVLYSKSAFHMPGDYFLAELIEAQDDVNKCIVADVSPPWYLSKEKKTQRTEMKKKEKEKKKRKKVDRCGWDSNQQLSRLAVEQNPCATNLSANASYRQYVR